MYWRHTQIYFTTHGHLIQHNMRTYKQNSKPTESCHDRRVPVQIFYISAKQANKEGPYINYQFVTADHDNNQ